MATTALTALLNGPSSGERHAGLTTDIGPAYRLVRVAVQGSTAFVDLSSTSTTLALSHRQIAQIVYTVTQFSTVRDAVLKLNGRRLMPTGEPGNLGRGMTRADFEDVTPAILVESPAVGDAVSSPLSIEGTANTFEATFDAEVRGQDGSLLVRRVVTATSGSGTRGTFRAELTFHPAAGTTTVELVVYEPSAATGAPLHVVRVPLRLRR